MRSADWRRSDCRRCTRPTAGRCGCVAARRTLHSRRTTLGQQAHGGVTSRASSCKSCSSWYKIQIHSHVAGFGIQTVMPAFNIVVGADRLAKYRPRCRSPTAVNPVKADVLQMLLHTSVLSPPAAATCSSLPNSSPMTSAGRKHSAWADAVDDVVFGVRRLQTYRLDVPPHGLWEMELAPTLCDARKDVSGHRLGVQPQSQRRLSELHAGCCGSASSSARRTRIGSRRVAEMSSVLTPAALVSANRRAWRTHVQRTVVETVLQ